MIHEGGPRAQDPIAARAGTHAILEVDVVDEEFLAERTDRSIRLERHQGAGGDHPLDLIPASLRRRRALRRIALRRIALRCVAPGCVAPGCLAPRRLAARRDRPLERVAITRAEHRDMPRFGLQGEQGDE